MSLKLLDEIMFTKTAVHVRTEEELEFVINNTDLAVDKDKLLKGFSKYKNRSGLYASSLEPVFEIDALYTLITHNYKIVPFEDFKARK